MIRIAITAEAFEAIAATLPPGSVAVELAANEKGEREIWLDEAVLNKLRLLRGPGESYSDVILRLAAGDDPSLGKQLFTALRPLADRLVRPSLAPIYTERSGKPPEQSGTGFLVNHHDRPLLVTAKHCLFDGDPAFEKLIFFNGAPRPLKELRTGEIISDPNNDLAVLYVDELGLDRCLPMSCLVPGEITSGVISAFGFLVRDFKRDLAKGLFPAPWLFHYRLAPNRPGQGYVGILYHKSRNRDATTGELVQSPTPRGVSGGPMLDTMKLSEGKVEIVGVFTVYEQDRGLAYGETAQKVIDLLRNYELSRR